MREEDVCEVAWKKLQEEDAIDATRRLDVVLKSGVYEYNRSYNQIDWTAVQDWRYMCNNLKVGQVVKVKNPDGFLVAFGNKIRDRNAVVEWVGPDEHGQFKGQAWIRFLKRNGRGKEFRERMPVSELEIVKLDTPACA